MLLREMHNTPLNYVALPRVGFNKVHDPVSQIQILVWQPANTLSTRIKYETQLKKKWQESERVWKEKGVWGKKYIYIINK